MGKRGPKNTISHEEKVHELQNHDIFYEDGKLKKESDPVWQSICENLENGDESRKITVRNIHTYVSQNRNNVIQDIQKNVGNQSSQLTSEKDVTEEIDVEKKLLQIKNNALLKPIIRNLSTYPFTVFYWTYDALDLAYNFKEDIFFFGIIGSQCQPFIAPDKSASQKILLFTMGINAFDKYIPICEFLSDINSVSLLKRFFHECLRSGLKVPTKLTIDHYWNHIISVNSVFNVNLSLENYLTMCYQNLVRKNQELPQCLIVTDLKLLLIKVKNWECLSTIALQTVKKFFLYCIVVLSYQDNVLDFQNVLRKIFAIAYSKYQNQNTDIFIEFIMTEIKNKQINSSYDNNYFEETENYYKNFINLETTEKLNYMNCTMITNFVTNIFAESKQYISQEGGTERNAYYNDKFCLSLIKLCIQFPLWTRIMVKLQESKGISTLKDHEKDLQKYLIESCSDLKLTADNYLLYSIEYNESKIVYARNSLKTNIIKRRNDVLDDTYLYYEENWKGLNPSENRSEESDVSDSESSHDSDSNSIVGEDDVLIASLHDIDSTGISDIIESICEKLSETKCETEQNIEKNISSPISITNQASDAVEVADTMAPKRGKYLCPCPEIELLHQKPVQNKKNQSKHSKIKQRKLIHNANIYPPRKVNKKSVIVISSSFVDCIIEILCTVYTLVQKFKVFVDNPETAVQEINTEFLHILQEYVVNLNLTSLYKARVKFIAKICQADDNKLSWNETVGEFYRKVMFPNILMKFHCTTCNIDSYQHCNLIKLPYEQLLHDNLIINLTSQSGGRCEICKQSNALTEIQVKYLLCFDVENTSNDAINLNEIQAELKLSQQTLILMGVIGFQEPIQTQKLRHYIAYSRNFNGSWLKYDNAQSKISRLQKEEFNIKIALVIYVTYD